MASSSQDLVVERPQGLYCSAGNFYIDPWRPVERALITHAHADHMRYGHQYYLAAAPAEKVMRSRLGAINLHTLPYGHTQNVNGVEVSFHPAGHVLGSAQIRLSHKGQVWVVSGDYKLEADPTCEAFEPVTCHCFITESTFGLPVYRWAGPHIIFDQINAWWLENQQQGLASVIYAYSFGKAQRIIAGVDASIGPIVCHAAVESLNRAYRDSGVRLPDTHLVTDLPEKSPDLSRALVIAPPSTAGSSWLKRFGLCSQAFASGWMNLRGARRRRALDRGFTLSDHADWPSLQAAIGATGAERVIVTHGYESVMVRWLQEQGLEAGAFQTEFGGEGGEVGDSEAESKTA